MITTEDKIETAVRLVYDNHSSIHSRPEDLIKDYMTQACRYLAELYENEQKTGVRPYSGPENVKAFRTLLDIEVVDKV